MLTNAISRKGEQFVSHSAQAPKHEEYLSFLSPEQPIAEGPWTLPQQRFLEVLQHRERQDTSITELCRLAGFPSRMPWYQAVEDESFAAVVQTFGIKITRHCRKIPDLRATHSKQRLLAVLQHPENRKKPLTEICHLVLSDNYSCRCWRLDLPVPEERWSDGQLLRVDRPD
jgi:hypothetical protein